MSLLALQAEDPIDLDKESISRINSIAECLGRSFPSKFFPSLGKFCLFQRLIPTPAIKPFCEREHPFVLTVSRRTLDLPNRVIAVSCVLAWLAHMSATGCNAEFMHISRK